MIIQSKAAAAAEMFVLMKARAARFPAENALPALNPNHPNHRWTAPLKLERF
jgi:hypothetical protein